MRFKRYLADKKLYCKFKAKFYQTLTLRIFKSFFLIFDVNVQQQSIYLR